MERATARAAVAMVPEGRVACWAGRAAEGMEVEGTEGAATVPCRVGAVVVKGAAATAAVMAAAAEQNRTERRSRCNRYRVHNCCTRTLGHLRRRRLIDADVSRRGQQGRKQSLARRPATRALCLAAAAQGWRVLRAHRRHRTHLPQSLAALGRWHQA